MVETRKNLWRQFGYWLLIFISIIVIGFTFAATCVGPIVLAIYFIQPLWLGAFIGVGLNALVWWKGLPWFSVGPITFWQWCDRFLEAPRHG